MKSTSACRETYDEGAPRPMKAERKVRLSDWLKNAVMFTCVLIPLELDYQIYKYTNESQVQSAVLLYSHPISSMG